METGVFHWERSVPPNWADELARYAPRVERASHLVLFWESGTPLEPVQRWAIYQATPLAYVPSWKIGAFWNDPVCTCGIKASDIRHCSICGKLQSPGRERIRKYLERTECLALPYWVIQGRHGGHRYQYTDLEKSWMQLRAAPVDPPSPGNLPYSEFDNRVMRKLRQHDLTRWAFANLITADRQDQAAAEGEFRTALSDYVDLSVESAFDDLAVTRRDALVDGLPHQPTSDCLTVDTEAAREAFIAGTDIP